MTTYSISEAAGKLGISVSVLRREIYKKKLTGRKFGGRVYILDSDLEDYVMQCSTDPANDRGYEAKVKFHEGSLR